MGLDLTLYPDKYHVDGDEPFAHKDAWGHTRLDVWNTGGLLERIKTVVEEYYPPQPLPANVRFAHYTDEGIWQTRRDGYGDPLTWLPAWILAESVPDGLLGCAWNRSVWAFLGALPRDTPVILYWS